ncbi:hypothetical protein CLOM_g20398 [Closterium sp. NIES-68]|nr:hypothetical protein CLOM_g20398 [Closterium sp. NIES-68]GJP67431.1 hypothetical protein CLOP_g24255 [Closterium sp. NIES-67]GJP81690.1 hypothetical protein CLOP_g11831 [Closterium sp. NIES-67]
MFSTAARLKERQGRSGTSRLEYLQALVTEFQTTQDEEAKEQIVANLANFAYDPINYDYMRKLNVFELFLDCLTEENAKLIDFGMGGLCNAAADPVNAAGIATADNIPLIVDCLSSPVESTILSALACLYYICTPRTRSLILTPNLLESINCFAADSCPTPCLRNLALCFMRQHVGPAPAPESNASLGRN